MSQKIVILQGIELFVKISDKNNDPKNIINSLLSTDKIFTYIFVIDTETNKTYAYINTGNNADQGYFTVGDKKEIATGKTKLLYYIPYDILSQILNVPNGESIFIELPDSLNKSIFNFKSNFPFINKQAGDKFFAELFQKYPIYEDQFQNYINEEEFKLQEFLETEYQGNYLAYESEGLLGSLMELYWEISKLPKDHNDEQYLYSKFVLDNNERPIEDDEDADSGFYDKYDFSSPRK